MVFINFSNFSLISVKKDTLFLIDDHDACHFKVLFMLILLTEKSLQVILILSSYYTNCYNYILIGTAA